MIQSAMRIAAPNELELVYTQCMMGFLLFHPVSAHILMVGLGGGSLAKFVYHQLPETKTTVIEINPQVISAATHYFALPETDERLEVILADGAQYIADHPDSTDILIVDGFDDGLQIQSLCSQDFYDHARQVLCKDGMLVVNNQPLGEVVAMLARHRVGHLGVDPRVAGLRVTGTLPLADTDQALLALTAAVPVEVVWTTRWWVMLKPRAAP